MSRGAKSPYYSYGTDDDIAESEKLLGLHSTPPKPQVPLSLVVGSVCLALMCVGIFLSASMSTPDVLSGSGSSAVKGGSSSSAIASSGINFTLKRRNYEALPYFNKEYTSFLTYAFLKPYQAIIEPLQAMELYFYDETALSQGYNYAFTVCPSTSTDTEDCQSGYVEYDSATKMQTLKAVKFSCSAYDKFDITLTKSTSTGETVETASASALCMYVRREFRTLTSDDLSEFMDASYALQTTSDTDGIAKYGANYKSSNYLVRFHYFNAAQQDQDHLHEGNGFAMQHIKITNYFDDALKAVNPAVSLPYWDFTIDTAEGHKQYNAAVTTADTYGNCKMPKNLAYGFSYANDSIIDGRIENGRWKDTKVDMNDFESEDLKSGFGYLRSPWNLNPSPYLSRFTYDFGGGVLMLPSCSSHYELLQITDLMDFYISAAYDPHATAHTLMAGFYGCDTFASLVDDGFIDDYSSINKVCSRWSFFLKELWRSDYIRVPKSCPVNETSLESSSCPFECNSDTIEDLKDFLSPLLSSYTDTSRDGVMEGWASFMCNGSASKVFTGDHLESASPADPTFWVMHPTLERVMHAKLMTGGFYTEEWLTDYNEDFICNRPSCFNTTTGTMDYYEDCCYGHYENDRMYDAVSGDRSQKTGMTNAEVQRATDPRGDSYSMPYIYDNFQWDHCTDDGEDFASLLTTLKEDMDLFNAGLKVVVEDEKVISLGPDFTKKDAEKTARRRASEKKPMHPLQQKIRDWKKMKLAENKKAHDVHRALRDAKEKKRVQYTTEQLHP